MNKIKIPNRKKIICEIALITVLMIEDMCEIALAPLPTLLSHPNLAVILAHAFDIIALISIGEECKVISDEGDWYKVEYGDYTGYISKEYAEPVDTEENNQDETDNNTTTENSNSNNTNANSNGEENNNSNTNSTNGAENTLTTSNEEDNQITDNSTTSLIGKITQKTNIKIVPLIYSSNLENINADEEVTVIEQINNWVYVQTDEV